MFSKNKIHTLLCYLENSYRYKSFYRLVIFLASFWAVTTIFILFLERYFSDSISIHMETTFLNWNNVFPAVTICLSKNRSSSQILKYVTDKNLIHYVSKNNYAKNIHDYLFINPNNMVVKEDYCINLNSTCGVNITEIRKQLFPRDCQTIFEKLVYLNRTYLNCSHIFKFHELQMGYCFLANNLYDYENKSQLPLKYSMEDKIRDLQLYMRGGFLWKYDIFINSPEDLPYYNSQSYDMNTDPTLFRFNTEDIYNSDDVADKDIRNRRCKFLNEKMTNRKFYYSLSACMTDLRAILEFKYCNCSLCLNPDSSYDNYCDIKGIQCLIQADISTKTKDYIKKNLPCYPSCIEQQQNFIGSNEVHIKRLDGLLYLKVEITNAPSIRYLRESNQGNIDLIVSAGGVVGLFFGASILNIIEFCTFFFLRIIRKNM